MRMLRMAATAWLLMPALTVANTVPTVEEQALAALLSGDTNLAINLLEAASSEDPSLEWIAGRLALEAKRYPEAWHLFEGDALNSLWGRIDLSMATGDVAGAVSTALSELERTLSGQHREALALRLVSLAQEQVARAPERAEIMLQVALSLEVSAPVKRTIEDALFSLPSPPPRARGGRGWLPEEVLRAARQRVTKDPTDLLARRVVGELMAVKSPERALIFLTPVIEKADEAEAIRALHLVRSLEVPPALKLPATSTLLQRFPESKLVHVACLENAKEILKEDASLAESALKGLLKSPHVGTEANRLYASIDGDPAVRRQRWLELAEREGASSLGRLARQEAQLSLLESIKALKTSADQRRVALEVLAKGEGQDLPQLLYYGTPDGSSRLEALWDLGERFPGSQPWCPELAESLIARGISSEEALKFTDICEMHASPFVEALHEFASEEDVLVLLPGDDGLEVLVAGDGPLQVSEHEVDPVALFEASEGTILETELDAFLMAPDSAYELSIEPDRLVRIPIIPKERSSLVSLTVRLNELQGSALVTPRPLQMRAVLAGDSAGLIILERDAPVPDAMLYLLDAAGEMKELRSDASGLALLDDLTGEVRLMARKELGLGFLTLSGAEETPETVEKFELIFWDRGLPSDGGRGHVSIFGARSDGSVEETVLLRSKSPSGALLEDVSIELLEGAASAEIWLQGGGDLSLWRGDELLASSRVPGAPFQEGAPCRIAFEPLEPLAGGKVTVRVLPVRGASSEAEPFDMRLIAPWLDGEARRVKMSDGVIALETDLFAAAPGDVLEVQLETSSGIWRYSVKVQDPSVPPAPILPKAIGVGQALALPPLEGTFYVAESEKVRRYASASEPLILPSAGLWWVFAQTAGARSSRVPILAVNQLETFDGQGVWRGTGPVLAVDTQERVTSVRLVRPGEPIRIQPPRGAQVAWTNLVPLSPRASGTSTAPRFSPEQAPRNQSQSVPFVGPAEPTLEVSGTLIRGAPCRLELGKGMPDGTLLWAFLFDASDQKKPLVRALQEDWSGKAGQVIYPAGRESIAALPIQAALLEEEERLAEQAPPQLIPLEMVANAQLMSGAVGGAVGGMGYGGGGIGGGRWGAMKANPQQARLGAMPPPFVPDFHVVFEGVPPGPVTLDVPSFLTQAHLLLVARTLEGRWLSRGVDLAVGGGDLTLPPKPQKKEAPLTWDGTPQALLELALSLPPDSRIHALAALQAVSVPEAALRATMLKETLDSAGPGYAIAVRLGAALPGSGEEVLQRLAALPDPAHFDRVMTALEAAPSYPDRAAAAARRLLREPELMPYVRAWAVLVLWAARDSEASSVLSGDDVYALAAKAILTGVTEPAHLAGFWTLARDPLAQPTDRALMIHVLSQRLGMSVSSLERPEERFPLTVHVTPPLALHEGRTLPRGTLGQAPAWREEMNGAVPSGRLVPIEVELPPYPLPTRLVCRGSGGLEALHALEEVLPSTSSQTVRCHVRTLRPGVGDISVTWHGPAGELRGMGGVTLEVEDARESQAEDAMSPLEQYSLGLLLSRKGETAGIALLKRLLRTDWLVPEQVAEASIAVLEGVRRQRDAAALIDAFDACRERTPNAALDLEVAAEVARAYARLGESRRAVNAVLAVLDVRFTEELGAIRAIQEAQLTATGLELLDALLQRYPEVPTVIQARYLAPSMLLSLAEQPDVVKTLGLTRASLRHTAVAGLARFLLLHGKAPAAPEAATLLMGTLHQLRDPAREQALAGLLAKAYRQSPVAWQLSVSEARAAFDRAKYPDAARILEELLKIRQMSVSTGNLEDDSDASAAIALELGRTYEAQGRIDEALEQYAKAGDSEEASARILWLERRTPEVPPFLLLRADEPSELETGLPPGTAVEMTAYRISLEQLLLRDGGELRSSEVRVDGLHPEKTRSTKANSVGTVLLPKVSPGAFLLTARVGNATWRTVYLRTEGRLRVQSGEEGQRLIHLSDLKGKPMGDARLWLFDSEGMATALRTDGLGSAFVPEGGQFTRVLAKWGNQYALLEMQSIDTPYIQEMDEGMMNASPASATNQMLLMQNQQSYEGLFEKVGKQRIDASML